MKVLSIRQPWAALILADRPGWKNIENRTWPTRHRGWIYIHAARHHPTDSEMKSDREIACKARMFTELPLRYGGIIGMVKIVDCVRSHRSPWAAGPWCWVLAEPYPLPFERLAGQQGLFDYGSVPIF